MLAPAQIIPFLTHPQSGVRYHAVSCLRWVEDPGLLLADRFWEAIDISDSWDSIHIFSKLAELPQTESSLDRMVTLLHDCDDEDILDHLRRGISNLDFALLEKHREELLNCNLLVEERKHLKERLRLADVPPQELWDDLVRLSDASDDQACHDMDAGVSGRLIEALARHPEAAWPAMETLHDERWKRSWLEIFAVDLLGKLRHAPAVKPLIRNFLLEDEEVLFETSMHALARIGTVEAVREMEAICASEPECAALDYAGDLLGHIKLPESEELLVKLAQRYSDEWQCILMLFGLTSLASLAGLDLARGYIERHPNEPDNLDLMEQLLATATMNGVQLPEAEQWQKTLEGDRGPARITGLLRSVIDGVAATWEEDDACESVEARPIEPLRSAGPKIGRNDPCPCGSGKKYKKCCLNKTEGVHT